MSGLTAVEGGFGHAATAALKVLIADDHPLMLAGLRRTLERSDGIEVVGEAQSATALLELIERRRPGLVVMDLRMPDANGTGCIQEIRSRWPEIKIVVLSASDDRASIDSALAAGASAYVVKSVSAMDISAVLRQACGNTAVFHASAPAAPVIGHVRSEAPEGPALTERERTILVAVARGMTTAAISEDLWVSEHTVKFHLTNIYRKLGVRNRTAAVRYALDHGIISV
jgi:DNA-binding NarL/FixJ family response regulator